MLGTILNFFLMNIEHFILREGMVGDTGFEPVISTVYKKHKIWSKFGHIFRIKNSRLNCLGWNIKTRWTQNPVHFVVIVGSTPSFSIKIAPGIL